MKPSLEPKRVIAGLHRDLYRIGVRCAWVGHSPVYKSWSALGSLTVERVICAHNYTFILELRAPCESLLETLDSMPGLVVQEVVNLGPTVTVTGSYFPIGG